MSGGIPALRGFDYQATVILDLLLDHFEQYGEQGQARPEGVDDLELYWPQESDTQRRYVQIKKPRENKEGEPSPSPWTLVEVVKELMPDALRHLDGNRYEQHWILGDEVDSAVSALLDAGCHAPHRCPTQYAAMVHLLTRKVSRVAEGCSKKARRRLHDWRPVMATQFSLDAMVDVYRQLAADLGAEPTRVAHYCEEAQRIHSLLPGALERTSAHTTFGMEHEVSDRVMTRLQERYGLDLVTVQHTLFRNLRGFINDISKQHGRWIESDEFELEIRDIWPHMVPVRQPVPLALPHIRRPELVARIMPTAPAHVTEAIGISGSGKSRLATELSEHVLESDSERKVFYAEVHDSGPLRHTVRDVLSGVAFHLRRMGNKHPFHQVIDPSITEAERIHRVGRALASGACPVLLIIDLRDGTCSESFSRDLAHLVDTCSERFQLVCFGQESALRALAMGERRVRGVLSVAVRGFHVGEFCDLVAHFHPEAARSELEDIYKRVTVGRPSGMYAALAQSLASLDSIHAMREVAYSDDNFIREAERLRLERLTEPARRAAASLACFALPFNRQDAEAVFPDLAIGAAVREMRTLGLIEPFDEEQFEMHETVRRGIEYSAPSAIRAETHRALAKWYSTQNMDTAEVFHLYRAGERERADSKARELLLMDRYVPELAGYVEKRRLVSAHELINLLATKPRSVNAYYLAELIAHRRDDDTVAALIANIREQAARFEQEFQWAWFTSMAALRCGPEALYELLVFALEDPDRRLEVIISAAGRVPVRIDARLLKLFDEQNVQNRRRLVALFARDGRRQVLQPVFKFLTNTRDVPEPSPHHARSSRSRALPLQFPDRATIIEFLASIPEVDISELILARSALIDPLTGVVWQHRTILGPHCRDLIGNYECHEPIVVKNAIRVLIVLGDPSLAELCTPLADHEGELATFATYVPVLLPYEVDTGFYRDRVTAPERRPEERIADVSILAYLGEDIGCHYDKLNALDPKHERAWRFTFIHLASIHPFPLAITLVADELDDIDAAVNNQENRMSGGLNNNAKVRDNADTKISLLGPVLMRLSELEDPRVVDLLIRSLQSTHSLIRGVACMALQQHRSTRALAPLLRLIQSESDASVFDAAYISAIASGLKAVGQLELIWSRPSAKTDLWRAIATARTRDASQASAMIVLALDTQRPWMVRRAAILAAGRLPYAEALAEIEPVIMREQSPFTSDRNYSLIAHNIIAGILCIEEQSVLSRWARGRDYFVDLFGDIFEDCYKEFINRDSDLPSGRQAAEWLYDRLQHHRWPENADAAKCVINELHIPILHAAVLRSLRLCGQLERIEAYVEQADSVWLAIRALTERAKAADLSAAVLERLESRVARSRYAQHRVPRVVLGNLGSRPKNRSEAEMQQRQPTSVTERASSTLAITCTEAVLALDGTAHLPMAKETKYLALVEVEEEPLRTLALRLDPIRDHQVKLKTGAPSLELTGSDDYQITGVALHHYDNLAGLRAMLRPAVVAANRLAIDIPWHRDLLFDTKYGSALLHILAAQEDHERFYDLLFRDEEAFAMHICDAATARLIAKFVDERALPFLRRYAGAGTDEFFEALCVLAARIDSPDVEPLLATLLYRWAQHFRLGSPTAQHRNNYPLWGGFRVLTKHPRFRSVPGYDSTLLNVATGKLYWLHHRDIVDVLRECPAAYVHIEAKLFKEAPFEAYLRDGVDQLDDIADELFFALGEPV